MTRINPIDMAALYPALMRDDPERDKALEEAEARAALLRERARNEQQWATVVAQVGRTYADCELENYRVHHGRSQADVLAGVRRYAADLLTLVRRGQGLLLHGPTATGKDHLAAALLRLAVLRDGLRVEAVDGCRLYEDAIADRELAAKLTRRVFAADLLLLSDPLPPVGNLNALQAAILFGVVDVRYRARRAMIITLNVADRDEAEERLGPQIARRLWERADVLHCFWPAFVPGETREG